ncbi:monovalent cation/H(+) antiporter subunit G [Wolbachia endosymbiont of Pentidionis agamae]|uniref:monovalent cation/H(+) antiporter subunit G n=1 Tax=Wolbachia endosymbiont of Pentidionis agamae TaxID=3110435 RepID=UPI002FD3D471
MTYLGLVFIFFGMFCIVVSSLGVIRFPDLYTRLHAAGITDSAGSSLLLIGLALQNEFSINTIKIVLLIFIIWITNSTSSYILANTNNLSNRKRKSGN